jgi:hypothetical protein
MVWEYNCNMMGILMIVYLVGMVVSKMFYFPLHIWDVILPIDELHHISEG